MRVYLDICVLKRPFDAQSQPRIIVESAAVVAIVREAIEPGSTLVLLRSTAHDLENEQNSNPLRAGIIRALLHGLETPPLQSGLLRPRVRELTAAGLGPFDAFHLAAAESLQADALLTVDDRFLRRGSSLAQPPLRLLNPVELVKELPR